MNFPDAFSRLLENRGIRRKSWDLHEATWIRVTQQLHPFVQVPRIEIYKKKPLTDDHEQPWSPTPEDVTATDWEVIPL